MACGAFPQDILMIKGQEETYHLIKVYSQADITPEWSLLYSYLSLLLAILSYCAAAIERSVEGNVCAENKLGHFGMDCGVVGK